MQINLLPSPPPALRRRLLVFWVGLGILFIWALESGISYYQTTASIRVLTMQYQSAEMMLHPLSRDVATQQKVQSLSALANLITQLKNALPVPAEAIAELQRKLPVSGVIGNITYSNNKISTTIYVNSYQQAAALLIALDHDSAFQQIQVSSISDTTIGSTQGLAGGSLHMIQALQGGGLLTGTTNAVISAFANSKAAASASQQSTNATAIPHVTATGKSNKTSSSTVRGGQIPQTVTRPKAPNGTNAAAANGETTSALAVSQQVGHPSIAMTISLIVNQQQVKADRGLR